MPSFKDLFDQKNPEKNNQSRSGDFGNDYYQNTFFNLAISGEHH